MSKDQGTCGAGHVHEQQFFASSSLDDVIVEYNLDHTDKMKPNDPLAFMLVVSAEVPDRRLQSGESGEADGDLFEILPILESDLDWDVDIAMYVGGNATLDMGIDAASSPTSLDASVYMFEDHWMDADIDFDDDMILAEMEMMEDGELATKIEATIQGSELYGMAVNDDFTYEMIGWLGEGDMSPNATLMDVADMVSGMPIDVDMMTAVSMVSNVNEVGFMIQAENCSTNEHDMVEYSYAMKDEKEGPHNSLRDPDDSMCPKQEAACKDDRPAKWCNKYKRLCNKHKTVQKMCSKTCDLCPTEDEPCENKKSWSWCKKRKRQCHNSRVSSKCAKMCKKCTTEDDDDDDEEEDTCKDSRKNFCKRNKRKCHKESVASECKKTCGTCDGEVPCRDVRAGWCKKYKNKCHKKTVYSKCPETCGTCPGEDPPCLDERPSFCKKYKKRCKNKSVWKKCKSTCGRCDED
jgi:hypothetical protein